MIRRFIFTPLMIVMLAPLRLVLGLPITYGMTLGNRFLQIGRHLGLYHGPIHYVVVARAGRLGLGGKGI